MAIILAVNTAFESFTQVGIKEAVVQNPQGHEREFLNGAWWLSCFRSVGLYALVFLVAPWIATFYEKPELGSLLRVAFLSLFFNGLMSAGAYVAVKKMKFLQWAILFHGGGIIGVLTSVVLGFHLVNVWALVIGFTVEGISRCLLSFIVCPFLPTWRFRKDHLASLLKYARGMLGLPILTFIFMRTDIFVIGKFFAFESLGLYAMARLLANIPFGFITMLIGQVMMPAFSERQSDLELINRWTNNTTSIVAFIGFPALALLALHGGDILALFYGRSYSAVGVPFAIIFSTALLRTCGVPMVAVYLALGKPGLHRLFTAIRAALILALIYPAIKWLGLEGAALAGLVAMAISYIFQALRLRRVTGLEMKRYFVIFIKAVLFATPVFLFWAVFHWFLPLKGYWAILPSLFGCLTAYIFGLIELRGILRSKPPALSKSVSEAS